MIINLVFTFSIPGISIGGHLGGLLGGGLAALLLNRTRNLRTANGQAIEIGGLVALCVVAVVGSLIAADSSLPPGLG